MEIAGNEIGAKVFHLDGGLVMRLVVYLDRDRALTDVGLAA